MERYYLKSWVIGFEVPFLNLIDPDWETKISKEVTEKYYEWFDVIKSELRQYQLANENQLIIFDIIVKVDSNLADSSNIDEDWKKMQLDLENIMTEMLKSKKLIFKVLRLADHE